MCRQAAHSPGIAFAITIAASGLSTYRNNEHEIDSALRLRGFSEEARRHARERQELRWKVFRAGGNGWDELREAVAKSNRESWYSFARLPRTMLEMNDANRERIANWIAHEAATIYDPVPDSRQVKVPVLALYGEYDKDVPTAESARTVEAALRQAGNRSYNNQDSPKSNHGLWRMEKEALVAPLAYRSRYDVLLDWLRSTLGLR